MVTAATVLARLAEQDLGRNENGLDSKAAFVYTDSELGGRPIVGFSWSEGLHHWASIAE